MTSVEKRNTKIPGLFEIFIVFLRIGFFTFGGGLAMAAVIRHELTSKNWLSDEEFIDSLSVATSFPGVIAVNTSLLVGHKVRGFPGALTALAGAVLPSFITIFLIAFFFLNYFKTHTLMLFFKGAGAAVAGLLAYTALDMGKIILKSRWHIFISSVGIFLGLYYQANPLLIIFISALAGYFVCNRDGEDDSKTGC
jgi:chromate transporter